MVNNNEKEFDHYLDALKALEYILKQDDEYYQNWVKAIQRDIKIWETQHQSQQHLGHYGGMGSFNDIGGGPYFNNIKSIAFRLAGNPDDIASVEKSLGILGLQLDGLNCLNCEYIWTNIEKIETYIRNHFIRGEVLTNFKEGKLLNLVKKRYGKDLPNLDNKYKKITDIAVNSDIPIIRVKKKKFTCPKCGSKKYDFEHWILNNTGDRFILFKLDGNALSDDIKSAFK